MFFANSFDNWIVSGIAITEVMAIVRIIVTSDISLKLVIWEMKFAAPVLDLEISAKVMNEVAITSVFIEPRRIRNCSFDIFPDILDPRTAA